MATAAAICLLIAMGAAFAALSFQQKGKVKHLVIACVVVAVFAISGGLLRILDMNREDALHAAARQAAFARMDLHPVFTLTRTVFADAEPSDSPGRVVITVYHQAKGGTPKPTCSFADYYVLHTLGLGRDEEIFQRLTAVHKLPDGSHQVEFKTSLGRTAHVTVDAKGDVSDKQTTIL